MCMYCDNHGKDRGLLELGDIFITQRAKYTSVGDGYEFDIPLNFCPNCGKDISLARFTSHSILIDNIKKRVAESEGIGGIEISRLTLDLMNKYKIDQKTAEKLIDYAKTH